MCLPRHVIRSGYRSRRWDSTRLRGELGQRKSQRWAPPGGFKATLQAAKGRGPDETLQDASDEHRGISFSIGSLACVTT